ELLMHLQSIGKYVCALDIIEYLAVPNIQSQFGLDSTIALLTAQLWMHNLDYRWTKSPCSQFIDGHECEDVVSYRQNHFLPTLAKLDTTTRTWKNGVEVQQSGISPHQCHTVYWWHDESTFYANDRRKVRWVHKSERVVPKPKGEGNSLVTRNCGVITPFLCLFIGILRPFS
ncbi:hypothetical protein WOLCODRAFT_85577, partial [Wolfiporia cocos MD-104 SS10]